MSTEIEITNGPDEMWWVATNVTGKPIERSCHENIDLATREAMNWARLYQGRITVKTTP